MFIKGLEQNQFESSKYYERNLIQ